MNAQAPSVAAYSARLFVGEAGASLGVDVQAVRAAPGGERVRVDHGPDDADALARDAALGALGLLLPLAMRPGEHMRVVHDPENFRVVAFAVPDHPDNLNTAGGA